MRALVISPAGALGGSENIVVNLARHHAAAGFELVVAVLEPGPLRPALTDLGAEVWAIDAGRVRQPHHVIGTVRELVRRARATSIDLVHSSLPKGHVYGGPTARRLGVPSTWSQGGLPTPPGHWTERVACRLGAARVITPSRASAECQGRLARSPVVTVINPGSDSERFHPDVEPRPRHELGLEADEVLVGMVGRLERWKNQHEFLRAAELVAARHQRVRFVLVGGTPSTSDDSYERELRQFVTDRHLEDRIVIAGDRRDMPEWMAAIDVMVNASDGEPFGLVVTEAMAAGCCVVAVDRGGPSEIITHETDGLLVSAPTPPILAGAIERLVADAELRARIGTAARAAVLDRFSAVSMTKAYGRLFEELVSASGGR